MLQLKLFVGLRKYTSYPSNMPSALFRHHFWFVDDVEDSTSEFNKFNWACLESSSEINVFKEKYHKTKLKENPTVVILLLVKDDDTQKETISVHNMMYIHNRLFCWFTILSMLQN